MSLRILFAVIGLGFVAGCVYPEPPSPPPPPPPSSASGGSVLDQPPPPPPGRRAAPRQDTSAASPPAASTPPPSSETRRVYVEPAYPAQPTPYVVEGDIDTRYSAEVDDEVPVVSFAPLREAQTAVARAEGNETVVAHEIKALGTAQGYLTQAEALWADSGTDIFDEPEDAQLLAHLSYMAQRWAQIAEARARHQVADQRLSELEEINRRLTTQVADLEVAAAESRLQARDEKLARLQQSLSDFDTRWIGGDLVLTFNDILFAFDKSRLNAGARDAILELSNFLRQNPRYEITVEGHTDSVGTERYNLALSERRAEAVTRALIDRGVDPRRMQIIGYGESRSIASNDTAEGRRRNRRVEVVITGLTEQ